MVYRIYVEKKSGLYHEAQNLKSDLLQLLGIGGVQNVRVLNRYDAEGIDLAAVKEIKEVKRARLTEYKKYRPNSEYYTEGSVWSIPCDIALPCATQNELHEADAEMLVKNGCKVVGEGANMPTVPGAVEIFQSKGIYFLPGKAANAGGVATSALEMSQNSARLSWTFEQVDAQLKQIMVNIYHGTVVDIDHFTLYALGVILASSQQAYQYKYQ